MIIQLHLLALVVGAALAFFGGELFLRGTLGVARSWGLASRTVTGAIAGLATSSPEMTIALTSAFAGAPEIALGNNLGGNIVNLAVVLGLALVIAPVVVTQASLKTSYIFAVLNPMALAAMLADGELSRLDSALLLGMFATWVYFSTRGAFEAPAEEEPSAARRMAPFQAGGGLLLLIAAARLIVYGASHLAHDFGFSDFVVGATVVALGTATPELATILVSRMRRHDQVAVGMILGSTIVSGFLVIGAACLIAPIHVTLSEAAPALAAAGAAAILTLPRASLIPRWRGFLLVSLYVAYVAALAAEG